jgi:capsular polysaccharide transport system permease protein
MPPFSARPTLPQPAPRPRDRAPNANPNASSHPSSGAPPGAPRDAPRDARYDPGFDPAARPGRARPPFQWARVIAALVIREMGTKFGRSAGGYLWAVAEPLGGITLMAIAFSLALRSPPLGTNFALFYATGIIPFFLFNNVAHAVGAAVETNRGLLRYPVVTPLDTVIGKFLLDFLTMFVVGVALTAGIIAWFGLSVSLDPTRALLGFTLAGLLGLGVGTLNCVLFGFFPTWRNMWNVITKPLFIASGLFYTFESLPRYAQDILWWNPLIHVVGLTRAGFYGFYHADYAQPLYVIGVAGTLFIIGAHLLRRHASHLIERP